MALAFAALGQPGGQAFGKFLWGETKTGFDFAVGQRQCIVKLGGVSEVAHAELVQPLQRAGPALAANHHIHREFLSVHEEKFSIAGHSFRQA